MCRGDVVLKIKKAFKRLKTNSVEIIELIEAWDFVDCYGNVYKTLEQLNDTIDKKIKGNAPEEELDDLYLCSGNAEMVFSEFICKKYNIDYETYGNEKFAVKAVRYMYPKSRKCAHMIACSAGSDSTVPIEIYSELSNKEK